MALADKKQELSQGPQKEKPAAVPQKEEKKDASMFTGRDSIKMDEMKRLFREKDKFYREYRLPSKDVDKFAERVKKYGGYFDKREASKLKKELEKEYRSTPDTNPEKAKIRGQLDFLKKKFGA